MVLISFLLVLTRYGLNNLSNKFAHLTNYSINKKNEIFKAAQYGTEASKITSNDSNNNDYDMCSPCPGIAAMSLSPSVTRDSSPSQLPNGQTSTSNNNCDEEEGIVVEDENNDDDEDGEEEEDRETEGYKWSLTAFRRWLSQQEGQEKTNEVFQSIYDIIVKTFIAAESEITPLYYKTVHYRSNCFELFGCDIILDQQCRPHLLEVNVSPSLMGGHPLDVMIKGQLMADVFHVVGVYPNHEPLLTKFNTKGSSANNVSTKEGCTSSSTGPSPSPLAGRKKMKDSEEPSGVSNGEVLQGCQYNPLAFCNLAKLMSTQGTVDSLLVLLLLRPCAVLSVCNMMLNDFC